MRRVRGAAGECKGARANWGQALEWKKWRRWRNEKKKKRKSHFTLRIFHHKWTTSTSGPLAEAHNSLL